MKSGNYPGYILNMSPVHFADDLAHGGLIQSVTNGDCRLGHSWIQRADFTDLFFRDFRAVMALSKTMASTGDHVAVVVGTCAEFQMSRINAGGIVAIV